jgi:serine/threonine-protein kinase
MILLWILVGHYALTSWEGIRSLFWVGASVLVGGLFWVLYIAIEPFVRRRWPQVLVSWTRLLSGDFRDPLVARDALAGCAAGIFVMLFIYYPLNTFLPRWLGCPEPAPQEMIYATAGRFYVSSILVQLLMSILPSLGMLCLLFLLRLLLRNDKVAFVAWLLLYSTAEMLAGGSWIYGPMAVLGYALWLFLLMRFGLVALTFAWLVTRIFNANPITLDASVWYAPYGYTTLAIFAAIVLYAFRTSLGGQPLFGRASLEDR